MADSFRIFISHFTSEKKIAEAFQTSLQRAFPSLRVFRSSDADSIPTGAPQYQTIIDALNTTEVMIVLLSADSARRAWVPFETGFALGRGAHVLTFLVRNAAPADIPSPFSEMLLRSPDEAQIENVLKAIEDRSGVLREQADIAPLLRSIMMAELAVPSMRLGLEAYLAPDNLYTLHFRLRYENYKPLTLQSIEVGIPLAIKDPNWPPTEVPGHLQINRRTVDGIFYIFKRYIANTTPPSVPGFQMLSRMVHSSPEVTELFELRFVLDRTRDVFRDDFQIRWRIETTEFQTEVFVISMADIPR